MVVVSRPEAACHGYGLPSDKAVPSASKDQLVSGASAPRRGRRTSSVYEFSQVASPDFRSTLPSQSALWILWPAKSVHVRSTMRMLFGYAKYYRNKKFQYLVLFILVISYYFIVHKKANLFDCVSTARGNVSIEEVIDNVFIPNGYRLWQSITLQVIMEYEEKRELSLVHKDHGRNIMFG
uniref:Uncharacterized protein n=1 Tax=Ditylenchus dipsaci TaxID=166011 RepID=A0A915CRL0_9BILA